MKVILNITAALLLLACSQTPKKGDVLISKSDEQLQRIISIHQEFYQQTNPFNHQLPGLTNAQLPDYSPQALLQQYKKRLAIYQKLMTLDTDKLSQENQINWSVLSYSLKNKLDSYLNKEHYMPLTAESGFHVWIADIAQKINLTTVQDYQDYLSRLRALPRYFSQQIAWMKLGLKEGVTQPKVVLLGFEQSIAAYIKKDVRNSVYYLPFKTMPSSIPPQKQRQLQVQAHQVLSDVVMPTYQTYYDFMVNQYQVNARNSIAAKLLPNGEKYYQNRVKHYTTLNLTPEQVHYQGLAEVERIRTQMDNIIKQVEFEGDFNEFIHFLRTDEQFYAKTPESLLKEAAYIAKQMDAKLPGLFKTLPRTPYGVMAVPKNIAPKYTTGRYLAASRDDQPGNYWVNTYRLERRPLYVLTALTLHEAVPGHHLQIALAKEMKDVPKFRNRTYISAFGEGWGLYSEYLGVEAGMYRDPYQHFGRLTYEMWRACRLVVDTGIHYQGWSREKAQEYLANNTALSLHNVQTEIDRYISWPGQALSYKIGELTIKKLRKKAEIALAEHFDLRDFHDEILKHGSMPLSMLEKLISQFIVKKTAEKNAKNKKREGYAKLPEKKHI